MAIFPIQSGGFNLGNQIVPNAPDLAGTHFSHWGVGGWVEVPSISIRNQIPVKFEMNTDGYSSGRRKVGMVVYTIAEKKFYQLLPKLNGQYVTSEQWTNFNNAQKIVLLDPLATAQDDDFNDYAGSGNPNDCWTELCLDCGGGGLEFLDVYTNATLTSLSANKIIHFHTTSTMNLTVSMDFDNVDSALQCSPGFNTAVMNAGAGMLTLSGVKLVVLFV